MNKLKQPKFWFFILLCVAINWIGRVSVSSIELPVWLDAIGTILAAMVHGPWAGVICGVIFNLLMFFVDSSALPYTLVSVGIGITAGYLYRYIRPKKDRTFQLISAAIATGFIATVISTPINIFMYGGKTGNAWGDGLMTMLSEDIHIPIMNSFLGEAFVDIPDKAMSFFVCHGILRLIQRFREKRIILPVLIISLCMMGSLLPSTEVKAGDFTAAEYAGELYDTRFGLASMEINAIAQTNDGYVWAGTYSGIYRYDGYRFREMDLDERINNVMQLIVDHKGRLWIGTNDSGVACYDPSTGDLDFYTTSEGLSSNVIRAITEDNEGNIFVATINQLCLITPDKNIKVFKEKSFFGIEKLAASADTVAAIRNDGDIIILKNKHLTYLIAGDYTAICPQMNGNYIVGTSSNQSGLLQLEDGGTNIINKYYPDRMSYYNDIIYSQEFGGYFIACENGLGFVTDHGLFMNMTASDFDSSISDIIIDYQGNIWFASSKQGVKRFTWNPFDDIFARAKLNREVVNSVIIKDGLLYVGTGSGLFTIDLKTYYSVPIPHPSHLKNVRIRNIMCDNNDNLWFSTYGEEGLIELKPDESIVTFNKATKNTVSERYRFAMQLKSGTILASGNGGLDYIIGDKVISSIDEADGLNTSVLCAVECEDGTIQAGTDGDGIYVIKDRRIVDHIEYDDGLKSMVVLKIVPCQEGYIYVTSNSLYYARNGVIKKLSAFPYSNNYDVYLPGDGNAWVLSSAGIYVVSEDALIANTEYNYALLNKSRGLNSSLSANSTYTVKNDMLYLCCTDGVSRISVNNYSSFHNNFNIRISNLLAGDEQITEENGIYHIPPTSGRIQFDVAVLNYTLSNPLLHIYLKGVEDEGITCFQNDMQILTFTNLPSGNYELHVQVRDSSGSTIFREEIFHIHKESQIFERPYFKAYLSTIITMLILYVGWAVGNLIQNAQSLEKWQNAATQDSLTGLLNKRGSQEALQEACQNDTGILMILDLDSFKPINDIYGHSMGDKILISVARLMQTCTREEDILCRTGGDEFMMFLRNAQTDEVIASKTNYINTELLKAAKTFMGKNMQVPLGVSVGAVKVPAEGRDYNELSSKADKALYVAKNNGKHCFSIYNFSAGSGASVAGLEAGGGLASYKKILAERNDTDGAYRVDYNSIMDIYRLLRRLDKASIIKADMVQLILHPKGDPEFDRNVMETLYGIVKKSLSKSDFYSMDGKDKVLIYITRTSDSDTSEKIERIINSWNATNESKDFELTAEQAEV